MAASGELTFRDPPRPHIRHSISFGKWIGNRLHEGEDGHGHTAKFASTDDLIKYWDYRRVRELLKDYPDICAKVDIIRTAYIRVFSILVSTCHLEYLDEFMENGLSDERLPLKERPTQWPESKHLDAVIKDFLSSQWRFCPLQINPRALTGQRLDDRHILPIVSKKILRELHGEAGIIRADFHTSCVEELPTAMILKAYTSLKLYKAEVTAFTKICNSAPNEGGQRPESIIECYGYFVQKDKYYLLLECAERNLESYFKHTKPPESAEDMFQFWKSMFKLVEGLTLIHNLGDLSEGSTSAFRGSHQDIKPGNILVNNKNPTNKYDITLKIADFGMSEFWQVSDENPDALGIDHKGDQWYSPPECAANFDALRRLDNQVGSELDIWSLGCVFSEAAVWAVCGYLGLQTYLEHRQEEAMDSMSRSGFSGCFHNGNGPLNAVTLMHNHILNSRRHWDTITPGVIDLVRGSMLLESMGPRKSARYLLQKSERLIQDAEEKAREEGYIQPTNRALSPLPPPPSANKITVEEVQQYRNDMKKNRPPNEHVATQCNLLKEKIKGRDQIFLVDDSTSMKSQHYNDVMNTFIALSYLAKKIDDNELDLFFTSQPATILSDRRTSKLLTEVQQHYNRRPSLGSSMEYSLSLVINHIIEKLPNPHITFTGIRGLSQWMKPQAKITLFVFTDGRWDSISGVENEITRLINGVKVRNLSRTSVTIQFIRFGDDLDGIGRLKYLDNFGKELGWDIVDTKSHKDHVPDMFIGSIDDTVDDNDDMI
ncbi:kinase-like domain-containing protein [Annulohypoxylon stygium]|nr:kinase-like domain-containing protein [Annulohypoxylon stygium]